MNTICTSGLNQQGTKKTSRLNQQATNPVIHALLFPTTTPLCVSKYTENLLQ